MNEDNEKLFLRCDCSGWCSAIELVPIFDKGEVDEDQQLWNLDIWNPCYISLRSNFFIRFKIIFNILFKGEYLLFDIVFKRSSMEKLRDYLNKI